MKSFTVTSCDMESSALFHSLVTIWRDTPIHDYQITKSCDNEMDSTGPSYLEKDSDMKTLI